MEKELPEGWEWKKLGEIGELISGVTYKSNEALDEPKENYIPILRANNINGEINFESLVYVPSSCVKEKQLIEENDILIAMSSGSKNIVGKTAQAKTDFFGSFGAFCGLFRCKNGTNKKYVGYYFKTPGYRNKISSLSRGANINNLRKENITSLNIPIPPLEIQQKIISILEKAEETKKLRAQADELTQKLLQSVFLEMFGDPVKNPKNFNIVKLSEVGKVSSGLTLNSKKSNIKEDLFPYLRVANVFRNKLDLSEIKYIYISDSDIDRYMLKKDDVLVVEGHGNIEEIGRTAVWKEEIANCAHQNHIIKVRLNENYMRPYFVSYFLNMYGNRGYFYSKSRTTSGLNTISTNKVRDVEILLPPIYLQSMFEKIVLGTEKTQQSQNQSSIEINNLFDALMQKAFTGELIS